MTWLIMGCFTRASFPKRRMSAMGGKKTSAEGVGPDTHPVKEIEQSLECDPQEQGKADASCHPQKRPSMKHEQ
jgi:hypothetical protein